KIPIHPRLRGGAPSIVASPGSGRVSTSLAAITLPPLPDGSGGKLDQVRRILLAVLLTILVPLGAAVALPDWQGAVVVGPLPARRPEGGGRPRGEAGAAPSAPPSPGRGAAAAEGADDPADRLRSPLDRDRRGAVGHDPARAHSAGAASHRAPLDPARPVCVD